MSYIGNYAPDLYNERKRYYLLQAQQQTPLTDAELRDLNLLSNTLNRRFIQNQIGDCALGDGFKVAEKTSDKSNNFLITGGGGTLDDPGVFYLKGYRLFLLDDITYKDQTNTGSITDDGYTQTTLPALTTPTGTPRSIYDIEIIDPVIAICGDRTAVVTTSDWGRNWVTQKTTTNILRSISYGDASTGYAVGDYAGGAATVLKTTDGGSSWNSFSPSDNSHYYGVSFVNQNLGWIVGENGVIRRTTDGAATWSTSLGITVTDLNGVHAADSTNVWAVGNAGVIAYTNDGISWALQSSTVLNNLSRVYAVDSTVIYAVGSDGTILKTSDGGSNWSSQSSDTVEDLNDLYFIDRYIGYAVGTNGVITKTVNGSTWDATVLSDTAFNGVAFKDSTGFIVGSDGTILRTLDGLTWERYRTDHVYIDFHLAEVSPDATSGSEYIDTGLEDVLIGLPNANRLRAVSDIKVSEGWPMPVDYTSGLIQHYVQELARLERSVDAYNIIQSQIVDTRPVTKTIVELMSGGVDSSAIADGAVTPSKIDSSGDYTVGSLYSTGDAGYAGNVHIGGDLTVGGILIVDDFRTSTVMNSLHVKGSTILGDSTSLYDDTVGIYGRVDHSHNFVGTAYNLQVGSTTGTSTVFNIISDGTGPIFHIERNSLDSTKNIWDSTNKGKGTDINIWHAGYDGDVFKIRDDASGDTFNITKTAPGFVGSVFNIITNSEEPSINISNRAFYDTTSVKIDQTHGTMVILNSVLDADAIRITSLDGNGINIIQQGSSGHAIDVTSSSADSVINIASTGGKTVVLTQTADEALMILNKDSTGTGRGLELNNRGSDVGLGVYNTGTGLGQLISHVGDSTQPGLDIFIAGEEHGPALRINKSNDKTGEVVKLWNQGYSETLHLTHDRTDSSASVIRIFNYSLGPDISSSNWTIDKSGNFFTHGDITTDSTATIRAAKIAFDTTHSMTADSIRLDYANMDASNPAQAGGVYRESCFLKISDGTNPSPIPGWNLSVYADNTAAVAGGLTAGAFYRTGGNPDYVCVVH